MWAIRVLYSSFTCISKNRNVLFKKTETYSDSAHCGNDLDSTAWPRHVQGTDVLQHHNDSDIDNGTCMSDCNVTTTE